MTRRLAVVMSGLAVLGTILACGSPAELLPQATNAAPVTPAVYLPAAWTPTAAPSPTAEALPGWKRLTASYASIWFPESFEGGDLTRDVEKVISSLREMGGQYASIAGYIEQNPSMFVLWVWDTTPGATGYVTNANIVVEQVDTSVTVNQYIDANLRQFPAAMHLESRGTTLVGPHPAGRMVIRLDLPGGGRAKELLYAIKEDGAFWSVTYATGLDDFDRWVPIFEQSIATFTLSR